MDYRKFYSTNDSKETGNTMASISSVNIAGAKRIFTWPQPQQGAKVVHIRKTDTDETESRFQIESLRARGEYRKNTKHIKPIPGEYRQTAPNHIERHSLGVGAGESQISMRA